MAWVFVKLRQNEHLGPNLSKSSLLSYYLCSKLRETKKETSSSLAHVCFRSCGLTSITLFALLHSRSRHSLDLLTCSLPKLTFELQSHSLFDLSTCSLFSCSLHKLTSLTLFALRLLSPFFYSPRHILVQARPPAQCTSKKARSLLASWNGTFLRLQRSPTSPSTATQQLQRVDSLRRTIPQQQCRSLVCFPLGNSLRTSLRPPFC